MKIYPGLKPHLIKAILEDIQSNCTNGAKGGLIIESFGSGNMANDTEILNIFNNFKNDIIIVNITQCYKGSVNALYQNGKNLSKSNVIFLGDMTCEVS